MMKYLAILGILSLPLLSCSTYTDITYRGDSGDKYVRGDGFMIKCQKDDEFLIVGTYTPDSWGEGLYYDYLKGPKTERKLKITSIDVVFPETPDKLVLDTIRKQRDYFYTSPDLMKVIDANKTIKITVYSVDMQTGVKETREFILKRRKHRYLTGTFPHV